MKRMALTFTILAACFLGISFAEDKAKPKEAHEHEHDERGHDAHEKREHSEEGKESHAEEHEESGEHGHDEGSSQVGPEKGILEASEQEGIKLSPETTKNFELETQPLSGAGPWSVPTSARLLAGEEVNLFRLRNGFYKRIDFSILKKSAAQITVSSKDLKAGDLIVTKGIGFLRIAEITAFGGAPEGHSH